MAKVMFTLKSPGGPPTLDRVIAKYNLGPGEIDKNFGVVLVDPAEHIYTILVEEAARHKLRSDSEWEVEGAFSNPRIAPS